MTNLTAVIIGANDTVRATFSGPCENGKFMGWITLGAEDRYRPLINSEAIYETADHAKIAMQEIIDRLRK